MDPRKITQDILKQCNVIRSKNSSVKPLRSGKGQERLMNSRLDTNILFGNKKLSEY